MNKPGEGSLPHPPFARETGILAMTTDAGELRLGEGPPGKWSAHLFRTNGTAAMGWALTPEQWQACAKALAEIPPGAGRIGLG